MITTNYELAQFLTETTLADGGGTFTLSGLRIAPLNGYAVSLRGGQVVPVFELDTANVIEPAVEFALDTLLADFPNAHYIGTWLDNGTFYLDPVEIVSDFDEAKKLAIANDQIAFYDFGRGVAVNTADDSEKSLQDALQRSSTEREELEADPGYQHGQRRYSFVDDPFDSDEQTSATGQCGAEFRTDYPEGPGWEC